MVLASFVGKGNDSENWIKGTPGTGNPHCEWSKYKGFLKQIPSTNLLNGRFTQMEDCHAQSLQCDSYMGIRGDIYK